MWFFGPVFRNQTTIDESLIYNEQTYGYKIQLKTYNEIKEKLQNFYKYLSISTFLIDLALSNMLYIFFFTFIYNFPDLFYCKIVFKFENKNYIIFLMITFIENGKIFSNLCLIESLL